MTQKHHWNISINLKIQWCFLFVISLFSACKSIKLDKKLVEKPNNNIEILSLINTKKDTFLQNNKAECKIEIKQIENIKVIKTKVEKVINIKKTQLEIPQKAQNQSYDDGRLPDGFSIASVVTSLLGYPFVGYILGPIAIVLGIIGMFRAGKYKSRTGKGYAIAGIILGIGAIVASFFIRNF